MTATAPVAVEVAPEPVAPAALSARGIVKRFGSVLAVDHADLELRSGIHALLGENGAGKSTLVKILYGYHQPDEGEILVDGRPVEIDSPATARQLGVGLVFQQPTLIPALTVTENIALFLPHLPAVLRPGEVAATIGELAERYGISIDPSRRAGTLSLPELQRVQILRVLLAGARTLMFDEPTSTLPAQEIDSLFAVFRRLREDGYPIILITHKLAEAFELADTVTVMRRGAVVASRAIAAINEAELVELMFGAITAVADERIRPPAAVHGEPVLELRAVSSMGQGRPLFGLDLAVRAGEIVGIAGVAGNGQRELAETVVGLFRIKSGSRLLAGQEAKNWSVRQLREAGVAYVPENPLGQELIWSMTLNENIALGAARRFSRFGGFGIDWRAVEHERRDGLGSLGLDLPEAATRAGTLSGGNAQRFALARELARKPRLLVALYPTHGLDARTTATVQQLLLRASDEGCGVLLVSQDLDELLALSDRLLVLREGRIVGEFDPENSERRSIGRLMTGGDDG
jgi:general nucleoside transport system ATP-binding protein